MDQALSELMMNIILCFYTPTPMRKLRGEGGGKLAILESLCLFTRLYVCVQVSVVAVVWMS